MSALTDVMRLSSPMVVIGPAARARPAGLVQPMCDCINHRLAGDEDLAQLTAAIEAMG